MVVNYNRLARILESTHVPFVLFPAKENKERVDGAKSK